MLLWDWSVGVDRSKQWLELNCAVFLSLDHPLYAEQENNFEFQVQPCVMFWLYIARHHFTVRSRTITLRRAWRFLVIKGHYEYRAIKVHAGSKWTNFLLESWGTDRDPLQPDYTAVSADSQSWCARNDRSCSPEKTQTVSWVDRKNAKLSNTHILMCMLA